MEHSINEIIEVKDLNCRVQVKPATHETGYCSHCHFLAGFTCTVSNSYLYDTVGDCSCVRRSDQTDVYFELVR